MDSDRLPQLCSSRKVPDIQRSVPKHGEVDVLQITGIGWHVPQSQEPIVEYSKGEERKHF